MIMNGKAGFSIHEWCETAGFSPALFFKRQKKGIGPRTIHIGRRTIVTEPAVEYYKRLAEEAASASQLFGEGA